MQFLCEKNKNILGIVTIVAQKLGGSSTGHQFHFGTWDQPFRKLNQVCLVKHTQNR